MAYSDQLPRSSSRFSKFLRNKSAKIRTRVTRLLKPKSSHPQPIRVTRLLNPKSSHPQPSLPDGLHRRFSLAEIKAATNNFHRDSLIGQGPFSDVYLGAIDKGSLLVAVKRRKNPSIMFSEFQMEVLLLCQLRHPHIVALIGFCMEKGEHILVYDYLSNGSLVRYLYDVNRRVQLQWKRRLEICIGVASALHYLHTGLKRVVVHGDVKSSNILMDDEWGAKITQFGFATLGPSTLCSKPLVFKDADRIIGTDGYLAPEYAMFGKISTNSDVFSFGVVLLEILSGQIVHRWSRGNGDVYDGIVDPLFRRKVAPQCLKIFLEIINSCLAAEADERPMIGEVEATLKLVLELQAKADSDMQSNHPNRELEYEAEPVHLPDSSNIVRHFFSGYIESSDSTSLAEEDS